MYNWDCKNCPLYGVASCPLFRGCLNLKGMEGQSGILELSIIIVGVHSRGCSISGVPVLFSSSFPAFGCIMYENRVHYCDQKAGEE